MTPDAGGKFPETDEQRKARHRTWLPHLHGRVREWYETTGRGYVAATNGTARYRYIPAAEAGPFTGPMVESYDPRSQFVIAVSAPPRPVGLYKIRLLHVSPAGEG